MEDITKLEDELQSLGGIVTYQKNRPSSVTIEVNTLNTYLHKACNQSSDYQPKSNTHCRRGHEYTPDNTLIRRREMGGRLYKYRSCRACNRLRWHYNKELRTKQGIK